MQTEIIVRFDYGAIVPWVSQQDDGGFGASPARTQCCSTQRSDA